MASFTTRTSARRGKGAVAATPARRRPAPPPGLRRQDGSPAPASSDPGEGTKAPAQAATTTPSVTRTRTVEAAPVSRVRQPDVVGRDARELRAQLRAARQLEHDLRAALDAVAAGSVTRGQLPVLLELLDGPQRVAALARAAAVSRQAAHQVLDGLEREGLVLRRMAADDARAQVVAPTPAGERLLAVLGAALEQVASPGGNHR